MDSPMDSPMDSSGDVAHDAHAMPRNILYQGTRGGIVGLSPMMSSTRPGQADWTERMLYDARWTERGWLEGSKNRPKVGGFELFLNE